MKIEIHYFPALAWYKFIMLLLFFSAITVFKIGAQEPPPRPVEVIITPQNLCFGAFYQGITGGKITIDSGGARSATGDIVLLNLGYSFSSALFHLVGNAGTVISILNGPDAILSGSNGGSMTIRLGSSEPQSPFVITTNPPAYILFNIGGSITVNNPLTNPPGNYSGVFEITFVQE
jgi:hypothetical protein